MAHSEHNHEADCCGTNQVSNHPKEDAKANYLKHWEPIVSSILLVAGMSIDHYFQFSWFTDQARLIWYLIAYLPVGIPVLKQAYLLLRKGDIFTEFFLMSIATLGAFYIGEYPEGVTVMLFYSIGEAFQHNAVQRARQNIKSLLDVRPVIAHVKRDGTYQTIHPQKVTIGEIIQVKPGERVPLDGVLQSTRSAFDTSALTGESKPRHFSEGEKVLSGMVNLNRVIEVEVSKSYENSSISRILEMVQEASSRKAKTELFIRSFARIYTPAVVFLATLLIALPYLFVSNYVFDEWLYRGLVFLVISCPCALVISIPLGYFGGIGAASRNGILIKGSNYLDTLRSVTTVVFDKTGTLTKGTFTVQNMRFMNGNEKEVRAMLLAVEKGSTHPIAKAITQSIKNEVDSVLKVDEQKEIPGHGIQALVNGKNVLIGNESLMEKKGVHFEKIISDNLGSVVHISVDGVHAGIITISDEVKEDSIRAIEELRKLGVHQTIMLSGDNPAIAQQIGKELKIDHVYGGLLPDEKAKKLEELKTGFPGITAYAGDGINDAPVLALSDVGIAMGAMGSDVAIETADVVIQTDQPSKIATAIRIGKTTRNIVWQNIGLAMGIKIIFLSLGALGLATLWEAVFADVGVALLAILNAIRIQKMDFS
ncbi:MAG: heavy metal translocating P-type ATPase [Balneolaceae bacterium]